MYDKKKSNKYLILFLKMDISLVKDHSIFQFFFSFNHSRTNCPVQFMFIKYKYQYNLS